MVRSAHAYADANSNCCCGHGARCNCALKKDNPLDSVPEDFPQVIQPKEPHKPRISSLNSHESKATIFLNGHHKPVHKLNDAHNHCGAPYRKPSRSHTVHGHRDFAQRSTDSLPLLKQAPRPTESPLHTVSTPNEQVRKVKSEHNSPELGPINPQINGAMKELYIPPLSPTAYSYSPFETRSPALPPTGAHDPALPETIPDSWFTTYDEAHSNDIVPCVGFNDAPPVDWSTYDFCANAVSNPYSMAPNNYLSNQSAPYANPFEHMNFSSYPRMNSSSGDISEAEEHGTFNRPSNLRTVSNASNDISSPGDDITDNHRLSTASSYHGTPQANMLAGTLNNLDIDEFVAQTVAEQKRLSLQSIQRQLQSLPTPPLQQIHTPPISQSSQTSPSHRKSVTPPLMQSQHSGPVQQGQQFQSPQAQQSPRLERNGSNPGFSTASQSPFGPEHAFTVHEAQAYAHMNGNENITPQKEYINSPLSSTLTEDPMFSAAPDVSFPFNLDDPREDEDWVR